jgi:hypothetical protein
VGCKDLPERRRPAATLPESSRSGLGKLNRKVQIARRRVMHMLENPFIIPLGAFVMVVIIVAIASLTKMRGKELEAHQQLRQQEMEHERKMKELEIEKAKLELEKARSTKNG